MDVFPHIPLFMEVLIHVPKIVEVLSPIHHIMEVLPLIMNVLTCNPHTDTKNTTELSQDKQGLARSSYD